MIVCRGPQTDEEAVRTLEGLYRAMGFGQIVHCTAAYHDRKIAYTSQLAHIVSNAYVKSPAANGFPGFTGGSFQDMTRIAGVDEDIWTRLYMLNLPAVTEELDTARRSPHRLPRRAARRRRGGAEGAPQGGAAAQGRAGRRAQDPLTPRRAPAAEGAAPALREGRRERAQFSQNYLQTRSGML